MADKDPIDTLQNQLRGLLVSSSTDMELESSLEWLRLCGPESFQDLVQASTGSSFDHGRAGQFLHRLLDVIASAEFSRIVAAYVRSSRKYRAFELNPVHFQRHLTEIVATSALVYAYRYYRGEPDTALFTQALDLLLPEGVSGAALRFTLPQNRSPKKLLEDLTKMDRELSPALKQAGLETEGLGPVRQFAYWLCNTARTTVDDSTVYALSGPQTENGLGSLRAVKLFVYRGGAGRFYPDPDAMRGLPATNSFCDALNTAWEVAEARNRLGDDVDVCWSINVESLQVLDGPSIGGLIATALCRLGRCRLKFPQLTTWAMSATVDPSGKTGAVDHVESKVRAGLKADSDSVVLVSHENQPEARAIAMDAQQKQRILTVKSVDDARQQLRKNDRRLFRREMQNLAWKTRSAWMVAGIFLFAWGFWPFAATDRLVHAPDPIPDLLLPDPDFNSTFVPPLELPRVTITSPREGEATSDPKIMMSGEIDGPLPAGYSLHVVGFLDGRYYPMEPAAHLDLRNSRWSHDNVWLTSTGNWRLVVVAKPDQVNLQSDEGSLPDGIGSEDLPSVHVRRTLPLEITITKPEAETSIGVDSYSELQGTFLGSPEALQDCRVFGWGPDRQYHLLSEHAPMIQNETWYLKPIELPASGKWTLFLCQLADLSALKPGDVDSAKLVFEALPGNAKPLDSRTLNVSLEGDPVPADSHVFAIDEYYLPTGFFGHVSDLKISAAAEGGSRFVCTWSELRRLDPVKDGASLFADNQWDQKYLASGALNPEPARFLGCMYLQKNNWGKSPGGMDFSKFRPTKLSWEARAIGAPVIVAFQHGSFNFLWDETTEVTNGETRYKGRKVEPPPFPCTLPFRNPTNRTLTTEWQTFTEDLDLGPEELTRVLLPFGWRVDPQEAGTTTTFEIRNVKWINENHEELDHAEDPTVTLK